MAFRAASMDCGIERFETIGLGDQGEGDGWAGSRCSDGIQLADGLIDVAGIEQHAAIVGVGLQVIGVQLDGVVCNSGRRFR